MPVSAACRGRTGRVASLVCAALFAALAVPIPEASAQGLFGTIFGSLGGSPRPPARTYAPSVRGYAPTQPGQLFGNWFFSPDSGDRLNRPTGDAGISGGSSTHCVRLCDGRHFPVPRLTEQVAPARICNALCPRAQTKVFYGSDPTRAIASDGTRYHDLENALVYREKIVADCSCTGNGPGGLAQIDVESDPTLRPGDVVATRAGLQAFKGSNQYPYRAADFTPIDSYARISADLRQKLAGVKVNNTVRPTGPVQKLTEAKDEPSAKSRPRRVRVQAVIETTGSASHGAARQDPWRALFR